MSPKPLSGMNISSGVKNCSTKQNLSPNSEYLEDLLQPNGHIFKDKPSSIISGMLTHSQKNIYRNTKLLRIKLQKFSVSFSHFLLSKEMDSYKASIMCEDLRPRFSGTSSLTDNGKS